MARGDMSFRGEGAVCSNDPPVRHMRGFTLVELIIGVAIVATVAAIAVPSYLKMIYNAEVARASGDITAMSMEIDLYQLHKGALPVSLKEVGLDWRRDPWGNSYHYLRIQGMKGKGGVRKDRNLVPLNSDYDLYSTGEDGGSSPPITARQSRDDIIRANNGGCVGLAQNY
jgi:general secretion pathway protein G